MRADQGGQGTRQHGQATGAGRAKKSTARRRPAPTPIKRITALEKAVEELTNRVATNQAVVSDELRDVDGRLISIDRAIGGLDRGQTDLKAAIDALAAKIEEEVANIEQLRSRAEDAVKYWKLRWDPILVRLKDCADSLDRVPGPEDRPRSPLEPPDQQLVRERALADALRGQTGLTIELLKGQLNWLDSLAPLITDAAVAGDAGRLANLIDGIKVRGDDTQVRLQGSVNGLAAQATAMIHDASSIELRAAAKKIDELQKAM